MCVVSYDTMPDHPLPICRRTLCCVVFNVVCDVQEEYIKDEMKNLKREHIRAKEEIKRIQSVPLVIGQFNEITDANYGIVGKPPPSRAQPPYTPGCLCGACVACRTVSACCNRGGGRGGAVCACVRSLSVGITEGGAQIFSKSLACS